MRTLVVIKRPLDPLPRTISLAAYFVISRNGHLLFRLLEKRIASKEVIEFLGQMLKHHPRRHWVVVTDQAPPHTSKKTKAWIASQPRLHVFHLPKYSPEMTFSFARIEAAVSMNIEDYYQVGKKWKINLQKMVASSTICLLIINWKNISMTTSRLPVGLTNFQRKIKLDGRSQSVPFSERRGGGQLS